MTWCVCLYRPSLIDVEEVCVVDRIVRCENDGKRGREGEREREKDKEGAK